MNAVVDLAVVGAGAAGLMAGIAAGRERQKRFSGDRIPEILVFDSRKKIGAKIIVSGGTRCNVTNKKVTPSDYQAGSVHFLKHVLDSFTPEQTRDFFKGIGVELILEPTGKYFPTTHSGRTVLEALTQELHRSNVRLRTGVKVGSIQKKEGLFHLRLQCETGSEWVHAKKVILATGGLSYPETGSDGTGLRIAEALGHTLVPTCAALTPLTTQDADWPRLSGVTFPVKLSFYRDQKKIKQFSGSFLFTHEGFSGPVALDISRFYAGTPQSEKPQIQACFLPEETDDSLRQIFMSEPNKKQTLLRFIAQKWALPERWVQLFCRKIQVDPGTALGHLTAQARTRMILKILHYPLEVSGVTGYKKAEATAGGVELEQLDFRTLGSKKVEGLYFAGEMLDVDGRIGGFNFQWAWSSGHLAGTSAVKAL